MPRKKEKLIDDVELTPDQIYLRNKRIPRSDAEFEWTPDRIREMKLSTDSLLHFTNNYFYINTVDDGKCRIKLYDAQKRVLKSLDSHRFVIVNASRQVGKTTLMTAYALWVTCFNPDKRVVIVANKEKTAINILRRIKMAYEELPNWLKPGAETWGSTEVVFGNDSSIAISTTSSSAARGDTVNVLIIDEMSHIPNHLMEEFWASVIPVISSTRKRSTKIFAVSTPNGTGNKFHEIFMRAVSGEDQEWKAEQINWWEVPGRGKKWKADMISSLGGDLQMFDQEFNCVFLERGESAVDGALLDEMRSMCRDPLAVFEDSHYRIWDPPQDGHIYGIGVDVSEGIGRAASVAQVLDFTDLTNIRQAACYHCSTIHPLRFAETLNKIGTHWGRPPMLIERNSCGAEVINALHDTHGYYNLVSYSPPTLKTRQELLGVMSHTNVKYSGVMNMRYWINTLRAFRAQDVNLVQELQTFVRYPNGTWRAKQGNIFDDRVMSLVWALFLLEPDVCGRYYEIVSTDDAGKPLRLEKYTFDKDRLFSLDSFYQNTEGAPLPAIIGVSPNSGASTGAEEMKSAGWIPMYA